MGMRVIKIGASKYLSWRGNAVEVFISTIRHAIDVALKNMKYPPFKATVLMGGNYNVWKKCGSPNRING
jgi:hypothetical protein